MFLGNWRSNANRALNDARRDQAGIDLPTGDRLPRRHKGQGIGTAGEEELRVLHDVTLLDFAVEALGVQHLRQSKAVVEQTEPAADDELRLTQAALPSAQAPGHADAGRKVAFVVHVGLRLIAQTEAEREAGDDAPVVLNKGRDIHLVDARERVAGDGHVLKRPTAVGDDLRER